MIADKAGLVSVIIPVHNGASFIKGAIDSVLIQEVPVEILVIDDGSTDDLDEVMRQYEDVPVIRYIKNKKNLGVAKTRNKGVRLAQGEYVAFLDCDDWWLEGKLKKQLAVMEEYQCVMTSTARRLVTPDGTETDRVIGLNERITYKDLLSHNMINCSSVLIKKSVALQFPMDHDDSHEDYLMWLRILRKYKEIHTINEPLICYRLSATGKSGSKFKSAKMTYKVFRYMGFGHAKSLRCFFAYAVNGLKKYYLK